MKRQYYILFIVLFGFFLTPTLSFACSNPTEKTEKACCEKENPTDQKKDCCKKGHSQNNSDGHDCDGNFTHSLCHCPGFHCNVVFPSTSNEHIQFVLKQNFTDIEAYISSGFYSSWIPPKIS